MAKNFTGQTTYGVSADDVFSKHVDEAFATKKFTALGSKDVAVTTTRNGDEVTLHVKRKVDVDVPGFARKVVQPTNTVELTEVWRPGGDGYVCEWEAETSPTPAKLHGSRTLTNDGTGCVDRTDGVAEVKIKVPLIGGKLEELLCTTSRDELEGELAWLKGQHG